LQQASKATPWHWADEQEKDMDGSLRFVLVREGLPAKPETADI